MLTPIQQLPDILVKKIAAGEVIERPASVVKELLENAVDAGGTRIAVHVEDGGRELIRVVDDGCGIPADELRLAITPHATSKLRQEDDLYRIASMGFRGEALASIGAVSGLRLVSRPHESLEGAEICVRAEEVRTDRAAGCPPGTTVEVRDLFFNVPARRKFMRNASTEFGHINVQFTRLAMAHPEIAFDLTHHKRSVHRLAVCDDARSRIAGLFSRELSDALIPFERGDASLSVRGYVAPPADARSNANWQYTFLNRRFIRDKSVQHAIREAHRGLIDPHRHPVVFLFLTVDPALVDVNVHPTKIEVRWQDGRAAHSLVYAALRDALQRSDLTPAVSMSRAFDRPVAVVDPVEQARVRTTFADEMRGWTPKGRDPFQKEDRGPAARAAGDADRRWVGGTSDAGAIGMESWRRLYATPEEDFVESGDADRSTAPSDPPSGDVPVVTPDQLASLPTRPGGVIQLHNTYLVCETDDGMVIIDQHALHERILFEQFRLRLTAGDLESQRLLLAETLKVSPQQLALVEEYADVFTRLGLEVAPFGSDSIAIHAVPVLLKDNDAVAFIRDLLDRLDRDERREHDDDFLYDLLSMMACKAAVKAGDPLTQEEIAALVAQKELIEKSSNCPHGRPTTLRLTVADLERQFKRT